MNFGDFWLAAPDLARATRERFETVRIGLLGTIRRDGTPRISPIEVVFVDSELMLGTMWQSRKALDLLRDPRYLLHNIVSDPENPDGEFKLRGRAADVQSEELRERFRDVCEEKFGWRPPEPTHIFALDIEEAWHLRIDPSDTTQHVARWRDGGHLESKVRKWTGTGFAG
jgi:hypothetical protein